MLEDIVVSQEMGQKLKAAGWDKPTAHYWIKVANMWAIATRAENTFFCIMPNGDMRTWDITALQECLPAPTAEEILRELPDGFPEPPFGALRVERYGSCNGGDLWLVCYGEQTGYADKSLSEAAAQMWLWCKEKKYL